MKTWRWQRGDVPVGCLVGGVVVVVVILIAIKVAPITIAVGEFDKEIGVLADRANRREYHNQRILQSILEKAQKLDLPVTKKEVDIKRTSSGRYSTRSNLCRLGPRGRANVIRECRVGQGGTRCGGCASASSNRYVDRSVCRVHQSPGHGAYLVEHDHLRVVHDAKFVISSEAEGRVEKSVREP